MIDFLNIGENISDEMLAAYIDGNATPEESSMIQNALGNDELLTEAIDIVNDSIPFGNGDWGTVFSSSDISELVPSSIASVDSNLPFGIAKEQPIDGESLFEDTFGFGLAATAPTEIVEDDHPSNDESDMMDGSEKWESTDDFSNMDNLNY